MVIKKYLKLSLPVWAIILVGLSLGLLSGCTATQGEPTALAEIQTKLLVRAPDGALPVNKAINVKSVTEASGGVSHVELYAVEFPGQAVDPTTNQKQILLLRADAAPFQQQTFAAAQTFTPLQAGHYVIKVVGYNALGKAAESEYIGFEVQ
jgi:hypothetical protein